MRFDLFFLEIFLIQVPCWSWSGITGLAMVLEPPVTDPAELFAVDSLVTPSRKNMERNEPKSMVSSMSDSESVVTGTANSGGVAVLLSLRRRRKQGPTLPSLLVGAAEDCRRLVMRREARLDKRRIKLPLLEPVGVGIGAGGVLEP